MEEVLARVDVDASNDPLGDMAEVGREVEEKIRASGDEENAAHRALDRNQAKDEACPWRIGTHRESVGTSQRAETGGPSRPTVYTRLGRPGWSPVSGMKRCSSRRRTATSADSR